MTKIIFEQCIHKNLLFRQKHQTKIVLKVVYWQSFLTVTGILFQYLLINTSPDNIVICLSHCIGFSIFNHGDFNETGPWDNFPSIFSTIVWYSLTRLSSVSYNKVQLPSCNEYCQEHSFSKVFTWRYLIHGHNFSPVISTQSFL